jgi:hypothetical protein
MTAVIFYAVPEAGDFPTKQIIQASTTVATCIFGTVGLVTHGSLMENKYGESSKLGKTNFILGIFGFLTVIAAPVLFMCGIGPVVGSIIGGAGAFLLLIPLITGLCDAGTPTTDPFDDQKWSQNLLLGKETIVRGTTEPELSELANRSRQFDVVPRQFDVVPGQFDDAEEDLEQAAGTKNSKGRDRNVSGSNASNRDGSESTDTVQSNNNEHGDKIIITKDGKKIRMVDRRRRLAERLNKMIGL